ncbi:hypothetical protein ACHHYP_10647 [Achlya hypogyna]|uniref:CENP-V/GFA domain-containing protein n=1 Tax=Achlya hypogyna TaxID=1202772 RepID=A0A1V9YL03_ACHHY|nr:hypothetical protein ACHHYP_10647 [Achlya hypogyna]
MIGEIVGASVLGLLSTVALLYKRTQSPPLRAAIACDCGKVQGRVDAPAATHLVCYCDDCQAFAFKVCKGPSSAIDTSGGTDIVQIFPTDVRFSQGLELLRIGIVTPKTATLRVFASCCGTPMYNTMQGRAFLGLLTAVIRDGAPLPPVQFRIMAKFATGPVPCEPTPSSVVSVRFVLNFIVRCILYRGRVEPAPLDLSQPKTLLA